MIEPLKIAMVAACPFPTSQGSQVLIRELSEALVERGHEVHIVTYHFGEKLTCPGLQIHRIPESFKYKKFRSGPALRKPLLDMLLARKLDEVVRKEKIDLIHCHNYEAPVAALPVRFLRGVPIVYHSHNTMSDEFYTYFRLKIPQVLAKGAAHLMDRYIPRRADYVIAINRRVAEFLIDRGTPADKVKYIPPGIDFGEIPEVNEQALRVHYDLGQGPLIVYAGNLDGYQRTDLLLDALPMVFKEHTDARLLLLTGSNVEEFIEQAENKQIADFIRIVRNPEFEHTRELMAISSIAVNPRISWSGFPIKILNYMAAGLPVVAFDGAAQPVQHGLNGSLALPSNVNDYSMQICDLLKNPKKAAAMGIDARLTAISMYNWNNIIPDIENIYAQLLGLEIQPEQYRSERRLSEAVGA